MTHHSLRRFPNAKAAWLFVLGFLLGCGAWFRVFGIAFFASKAESLREAVIWWFAAAAIVSTVIAAFQPSARAFWSMSFAVPIVGWCLLCTLYAFGDTRYLWWTWLGSITAVAAFAGALLGRFVGRRFA